MSKIGQMNVDFSEYYDVEDDVYYVAFKTGEPSFVMEVDDILLIEVGIFTKMPTGFRILNFKKHKISKVSFVQKQVEKIIKSARSEFESTSAYRGIKIENSIEKLLGRS
jgi:hypothetical protein